MNIRSRINQLGQGMTEYIIIVALIAIAAITVYGLFGDTIRTQMGIMTEELAGADSSKDTTATQDVGTASDARGLSDFKEGASSK